MKRIAAILSAMALSLCALAQSSIKVNVQNLVALDEQFSVTFVIEGEGKPSAFQWEPGDKFQLVWGPQKGSSSSISIVNGKRSQSSQTTYTYVLLPRSTGTFQLPAATATVKGKEITSGSFSVQVVSNGAAQGGSSRQGGGSSGSSQGNSSQGSAAQGSQGSAAQSGTVDGEDLFMRLSLSKTRAVVGETITVTLKLYHRVNIGGFEDAKFPSFNGFWSQELQAPSNIEFHRESIGDHIYNAAVLRSWTLIPQQAGELVIDPAELVCLVNIRNRRASSGSIFDSFFQDDYTTIRKRVTTPAVKVQVSRIPAGAPASFGGGVGNFRMSASLSRDSLQTHDAASLRVVVSGKGNISLLEAPKVNFPPDFEVYDVKTTESAGSKTFEYPFIPRSHGNFVIGPVEYSYYDVNAGKFVTLSSQEMPLKVSKGADSTQAQDATGQLVVNPSRKDVRDLGSDIRFIATRKPSFSKAGAFFVGSGAFWLIAALLCLLAAGLYFGLRAFRARRSDVAGNKNRGAVKMARKRLSQAGEFLQKDLYTAFYEELHKALLGFVGDKLNMPAGDLSKENISERLIAGGASEEQASRFTSLLDACEFARYAPSEGHGAMQAHYEGAVAVISEIDSAMKKNSSRGGGGSAALLCLLLLAAPLSGRAAAPMVENADGQTAASLTAGAGSLNASAGSLTADAGVQQASSGSLTADAGVQQASTGSLTANAGAQQASSGSLTADAGVQQASTGSLTADAGAQQASTGSQATEYVPAASNGRFAGTDTDALWEKGCAAYADGRWQEAFEAWDAIATQGLESAELYCNMGDACYKNGELAQALLWYERAVKADPSYGDARFNLEFVRSLVQDRIEEVPEFFLETWGRKACWLLPSGVWAVLCLVFLAGALAMLLLFLLGRGGARKAGFFAGLALLLCTLLCLDFAFWQRTDALKHDSAIVTAAVTEVKSSPGSGVSLFVLHEGTKVKVLETVGDWQNIELADGRQGWLQSGSITVI